MPASRRASPAARPSTSARISRSEPLRGNPSLTVGAPIRAATGVPSGSGLGPERFRDTQGSFRSGRDKAHRPLRQRADGQAGVDPQVGGDHGAVADVQVPIAEQAFSRIHYAAL